MSVAGLVLAAGSEVPTFLPELVALVGGAAIVGYLSSRLRVVPIVGFLVAGVIIGPAQLGLVQEREVVDAAAEIGVILLLFTIGIEFSLERLASMARLIGVAGGAQVGLATGVTTARAVVVADDAHERTTVVVGLVRDLVPLVPIVARPVEGDDLHALAAAGADHVLTAERASTIGLAATIRSVLGHTDARAALSSVVRFVPPSDTGCAHTDVIRPVQPSAPGARTACASAAPGCTCASASPAGTSGAATPRPAATHEPTPRTATRSSRRSSRGSDGPTASSTAPRWIPRRSAQDERRHRSARSVP